jgi:hypothetical protein
MVKGQRAVKGRAIWRLPLSQANLSFKLLRKMASIKKVAAGVPGG